MALDYDPKPIETDHIALNGELLHLVEVLAENAHDIWARQRMQDGWTYGPERNDILRHHPDLVPYAQFSEADKTYDRNAILVTIRAVLALGFVVSSRSSHNRHGVAD